MRHRVPFMVSGFFLVFSAFLWASEPVPEYMPYCMNPQRLGPMHAAGGSVLITQTAGAWNGQEYAIV